MKKRIAIVLAVVMVLASVITLTACGPEITVTLDATTMSLEVGEQKVLVATVEGDESATAVFASSNTAIATVTAGGRVKGIAAGTANITATVGDVVATCVVTVVAASTEDPVVTFEVTLADGVEPLKDWEHLYVVGSFEGWSGGKDSTFEMVKDPTNERRYTLTVTKKTDATTGAEVNVFAIGDTVEYKYAIGPTASAWAYGQKQADGTSEIANIIFTVKGGQNTSTTVIEGFAARMEVDPSLHVPGDINLKISITLDEDIAEGEAIGVVGNFGADGDPYYWIPTKDDMRLTKEATPAVEGKHTYSIQLSEFGKDPAAPGYYKLEGGKGIQYKLVKYAIADAAQGWDAATDLTEQVGVTTSAGSYAHKYDSTSTKEVGEGADAKTVMVMQLEELPVNLQISVTFSDASASNITSVVLAGGFGEADGDYWWKATPAGDVLEALKLTKNGDGVWEINLTKNATEILLNPSALEFKVVVNGATWIGADGGAGNIAVVVRYVNQVLELTFDTVIPSATDVPA